MGLNNNVTVGVALDLAISRGLTPNASPEETLCFLLGGFTPSDATADALEAITILASELAQQAVLVSLHTSKQSVHYAPILLDTLADSVLTLQRYIGSRVECAA